MTNISTKLFCTVFSSITTLLIIVPEVEALTIIRNFTDGNPPPRTSGEGNIVDVFNSEFTTINLNPEQIPPQPPSPPNQNLLPNGSFETGDFTNWETIGDTSLRTAAFGPQPTDGLFQALLSTDDPTVPAASIENFLGLDIGSLDDLGNGTATVGSAIQQTFTANAGDILTFDWNFLTNEGTPTFFNDFAFVSISSLSELADTTFPDFFSSLSPFNEETGFQSFSFTIPTSGTYSLGLGITDVGDTIVDSGLLIDNVALKTVPEPASVFGLFAFSLFGFRITLKRKQ